MILFETVQQHSNGTNTSVTFATAAVGSEISTANKISMAAAAFPRSHTVAVTYVKLVSHISVSRKLMPSVFGNVAIRWCKLSFVYDTFERRCIR